MAYTMVWFTAVELTAIDDTCQAWKVFRQFMPRQSFTSRPNGRWVGGSSVALTTTMPSAPSSPTMFSWFRGQAVDMYTKLRSESTRSSSGAGLRGV